MANKNKNKSSKASQKPTQLLKSCGSKSGAKEVKKFERKAPDKPVKSVVQYAKKEKDVRLAPSAKKYLKGKNVITSPKGGSGGKTGEDLEGGGYFERIPAAQESLANIVGGYDVQVATIGAGATTEAARLRSEADKYISDNELKGTDISSARSLEGVKYGADKESEWRQAVANIEVKGKLDLQPIINAGLEKVAGIEAQAQRDVAETTGKYNVEGIRVRGEADKQIGGMQLAGNMYNLLNAAFG